MKLTVKLFASFRERRFEVAEVDRPEGSTLGELLDALAIPRAELGILLLRGRHAELTDRPGAGDTVSIFPKVGGG
jgi:molybdopterin converting factor small subunit